MSSNRFPLDATAVPSSTSNPGSIPTTLRILVVDSFHDQLGPFLRKEPKKLGRRRPGVVERAVQRQVPVHVPLPQTARVLPDQPLATLQRIKERIHFFRFHDNLYHLSVMLAWERMHVFADGSGRGDVVNAPVIPYAGAAVAAASSCSTRYVLRVSKQ